MTEIEAVPTESGTTPPEPDQPRPDHAVAAFLPRLAIWAAVLVVEVVADPDPALSLLLIALAGVVTIVTDSRFAWEQRLEAAGVPTREAWVPLLMLLLMMQLDLVQPDGIGDVLVDKGPVIVFILAFALVAEGLRRSGFIHYLAYRLAERGGANTTRLMLYLFLLSSVLTYVTSNDIVILTMTPIVVSVAYQARIRNAKLLLLSQFIAANTVSMGLLIGSPTNLILGQAMDIRFVEYFFLMLAPSVMALMATFVFVTALNRLVERRADTGGRLTRRLIGTWAFSSGYRPPHFSEHQVLTREMRVWVGMFALSVALLTVGTASSTGLFLAALAIAAIGLATLRYSARLHGEVTDARFFGRTFRVFPLGIVFFGLTYFVLADAIADTRFVQGDVDEYVTDNASRHTPVVSWSAMLGSGALVNVMNDLPASALSGTVLERAELATPFDRALVVEGALTGLNTATYVTPVGALAGIIWFDILRKERRRRHLDAVDAGQEPFDVVMPQRRDLVVYGTTMFLATTAVLGATNYAFVAASDVLLGGPGESTRFGALANAGWMVLCGVAVVAVVLGFRRALAAAGVALARLGDVFAVVTRVRLWAARHRVMASVGAVVLLLLGGLVLLYWAEGFYVRQHPRVDALFDDVGGFLGWLPEPLSSGFESDTLPRTLLGRILPALLLLGGAAAVVGLARLSPAPAPVTEAAPVTAAPPAPASAPAPRHEPVVTVTGRAGRRAGRRPRRGGRLRRR